MKKILLIITALLFPFVVSCKRMEPEIVEFDPSYKPKAPTGIDRSKVEKPKVDLLDQVLYFANNNHEVQFQIEQDGETLTPQPLSNITVEVQLSRAATSELTATIATMTAAEYPETYKSVIYADRMELPTEMYSLAQSQVTFAVNDFRKSVELSFNTESMKALEAGKTYYIPLVVKASDANIKVRNFFLVAVTVEVVEAGSREPIALNAGLPAGVTAIPHTDVTPLTSYASEHTWKLTDGSTSTGNWWVPGKGSAERLDLLITTGQELKAMKIECTEGKNLSGFTLSASATDSSALSELGTITVTNPENSPVIYVVFNRPSMVKYLRFTNFTGVQSYINIGEITLYY